MPTRGYQVTMNGPCYVDLVDRYLMCHGTKELGRRVLSVGEEGRRSSR